MSGKISKVRAIVIAYSKFNRKLNFEKIHRWRAQIAPYVHPDVDVWMCVYNKYMRMCSHTDKDRNRGRDRDREETETQETHDSILYTLCSTHTKIHWHNTHIHKYACTRSHTQIIINGNSGSNTDTRTTTTHKHTYTHTHTPAVVVASIDLIALLVIEESSHIFQCWQDVILNACIICQYEKYI